MANSQSWHEFAKSHTVYFLPELPPRKRVLRIDLIKPIVRKRRKWNEEETKWLADGVEKFGAGNWATILKGYPFKGRTAVNLKDRWRNMQH